MQDSILIASGLIGAAIILASIIYSFGRLKLEQQKTLQLLLEKDESTRAEWVRIMGPAHRAESDFRRGALLLCLGISLTVLFFFIGGIAWMFGFVPITVGLVYLIFWLRNPERS